MVEEDINLVRFFEFPLGNKLYVNGFFYMKLKMKFY